MATQAELEKTDPEDANITLTMVPLELIPDDPEYTGRSSGIRACAVDPRLTVSACFLGAITPSLARRMVTSKFWQDKLPRFILRMLRAPFRVSCCPQDGIGAELVSIRRIGTKESPMEYEQCSKLTKLR